MKKLFKDWNLFEICFLFISLFIVTICYFLGTDKNIFVLIASILGIITVILSAKGLVFAPIVNIIYNVFYIYLSFKQHFYGEVLIYLFMMIPLNIMTIVSWLRNKSKENENIVEVNKINLREYILLGIGSLVVSIGFYYLLKYLGTSALLISTISLVDSFLGEYLMLRRSSNYALSYTVNDIVLIVLWMFAVDNNGISSLPLVLTFGIFLVNDIYGFICWKKREKEQKR